jgi:Flp pilus assembly pilin Flp
MTGMLQRFWRDEQGAEMVEWALVTIVLLIFTVTALLMLREEIIKLFQDVFAAIQADPPDSY